MDLLITLSKRCGCFLVAIILGFLAATIVFRIGSHGIGEIREMRQDSTFGVFAVDSAQTLAFAGDGFFSFAGNVESMKKLAIKYDSPLIVYEYDRTGKGTTVIREDGFVEVQRSHAAIDFSNVPTAFKNFVNKKTYYQIDIFFDEKESQKNVNYSLFYVALESSDSGIVIGIKR